MQITLPPSGSTPFLPDGLDADWSLKCEVPCPHCHYLLQGLRTPRCPECGTVFRWQTLLQITCPRCAADLSQSDGAKCPACNLDLRWEAMFDAFEPRSNDQFEYALRPVRAASGLILWFWDLNRLWSTVKLEDPPNVMRLRRLPLVIGLSLLVAMLGVLIANLYGTSAPFGPSFHYVVGAWLTIPIITLTFPIVFLLGAPLFTPTLAQFRVRSDRLLRINTYATLPFAWIAFVLLLSAISLAVLSTLLSPKMFSQRIIDPLLGDTVGVSASQLDRIWSRSIHSLIALIALSSILWTVVYYPIAFSRHLRMDRRNVRAITLSLSCIAALLWLVLMCYDLLYLHPTGQSFLAQVTQWLGLV